jgi:hypothetical protein
LFRLTICVNEWSSSSSRSRCPSDSIGFTVVTSMQAQAAGLICEVFVPCSVFRDRLRPCRLGSDCPAGSPSSVTFFETSMAALASSYRPQRFPVNFRSISCTSCRSRTDMVRSARLCAAPYTAPTDSEGAVSRTMPTTPLRGRHRQWVDVGLGAPRANGQAVPLPPGPTRIAA